MKVLVPLLVTVLCVSAVAQTTITVKSERKVDVRKDAIDRVAKLLCEAEGKYCNADPRCSPSISNNYTTCSLVNISEPYVWVMYREQAEKLLKEAFK